MPGLTPKQDNSNYLYILGSTGDFRMKVDQNTAGAVFREYETSVGTKGGKWELSFESIEGYITNIAIRDGEYGKNILVTFSFGNDQEPITASISAASSFGEDLMKRLPGVDPSKLVTLRPFAFTDDNNRVRKGVSVLQEGEGLKNFFYDPEKKENLHGYPVPEGATKDYDKDDWKTYFIKARKFLLGYMEEHVAPKFGVVAIPEDSSVSSPAEDVPF